MSQTTVGYLLPTGTTVYFNHASKVLQCGDFFSYLDYVYDPNDGLWASDSTRLFWAKFPHIHPHATLFSILRVHCEILEIKDHART